MEELAATATLLAENVQNVNARSIEMGEDITNIDTDVKTLNINSTLLKDANDKAVSFMATVLESSNKSDEIVNRIAQQIESTNYWYFLLEKMLFFVASLLFPLFGIHLLEADLSGIARGAAPVSEKKEAAGEDDGEERIIVLQKRDAALT